MTSRQGYSLTEIGQLGTNIGRLNSANLERIQYALLRDSTGFTKNLFKHVKRYE